MQIIECSQGGAEWFSARLGKPTASHFGDIVTPTGKARTGATVRGYLIELLGERLTGLPTQHFETAAMERGTMMEPQARTWYEYATKREVRQVGFITEDSGRWGGSPDGLCDDRGVEIKCPMQQNFVDVAESCKIPEDYMMQIQGLLWITKLPRWDFILFTDAPGLLPVVIEVVPDVKIFEALEETMPKFCATLDAMEAAMRERGHGFKPQPNHDIFEDPFIP